MKKLTEEWDEIVMIIINTRNVKLNRIKVSCQKVSAESYLGDNYQPLPSTATPNLKSLKTSRIL